jgi:hypothetical protein
MRILLENLTICIPFDTELVRDWVKSGNIFKTACQLRSDGFITYEEWYQIMNNHRNASEKVHELIPAKFRHFTGWNIIE